MTLNKDEMRLSIVILVFTIFVTIMVLAPMPNASVPDEVEIPVLMDVSGPNAEVGQDYVRGMEMAVDDINRSGSCNYSIRVYDTGGDTERALEQFEAILEAGSPLMVGPLTGEEAMALPIEGSDIVCISPSASSDFLKEVEGFYRTHCSDSYILEAVAEVLHKGGMKGVAVVYTLGNSDSEAKLNAFIRICEERFPDLTPIPLGVSEDADADALLSRFSQEMVDATLVVTAHGDDFVDVYNKAKALGLEGVCIGMEQILTDEVAKLEGVYVLTATRSVTFSDFVERFSELYGREPINAMYGYDIINMIKEVIDFNGYDVASIKTGLDSIRFIGLIGLITFDEYGECIPAFDTLTGVDGKWTVVSWNQILEF